MTKDEVIEKIQYYTVDEDYLNTEKIKTEAKIKQQTDLIYAETEAKKTIIESQAMATKRSQEGYSYYMLFRRLHCQF